MRNVPAIAATFTLKIDLRIVKHAYVHILTHSLIFNYMLATALSREGRKKKNYISYGFFITSVAFRFSLKIAKNSLPLEIAHIQRQMRACVCWLI